MTVSHFIFAVVLHRLDGKRITLDELLLVPVGINPLHFTGLVEFGDLFWSQIPSLCRKVLAQLFLVTCADDNGRHSRALEEPVECDLRNCFSGLFGDFIESVDHVVKMLFGNWRPLFGGLVQAAFGR